MAEQKKTTAKGMLFEYDHENNMPKMPRVVDVEYVWYEEDQRWEPTLESVRSHIGEVWVDSLGVSEFVRMWIDDEGRLKEPAYVNVYLRTERGIFDLCRTCLLTLDEPAPLSEEATEEDVARAKRLKDQSEELVLKLNVVAHIRPGGKATPAEPGKMEVTTFSVPEIGKEPN